MPKKYIKTTYEHLNIFNFNGIMEANTKDSQRRHIYGRRIFERPRLFLL